MSWICFLSACAPQSKVPWKIPKPHPLSPRMKLLGLIWNDLKNENGALDRVSGKNPFCMLCPFPIKSFHTFRLYPFGQLSHCLPPTQVCLPQPYSGPERYQVPPALLSSACAFKGEWRGWQLGHCCSKFSWKIHNIHVDGSRILSWERVVTEHVAWTGWIKYLPIAHLPGSACFTLVACSPGQAARPLGLSVVILYGWIHKSSSCWLMFGVLSGKGLLWYPLTW